MCHLGGALAVSKSLPRFERHAAAERSFVARSGRPSFKGRAKRSAQVNGTATGRERIVAWRRSRGSLAPRSPRETNRGPTLKEGAPVTNTLAKQHPRPPPHRTLAALACSG